MTARPVLAALALVALVGCGHPTVSSAPVRAKAIGCLPGQCGGGHGGGGLAPKPLPVATCRPATDAIGPKPICR